MDENLVGYLLNALDPDTHREVESYLAQTPAAQKRLELLRQAMDPLAADHDEIEPPPDLVMRTLAGVAEYRCRPLPKAPAPPVRSAGPARRWWQRADLMVAAGIFLTILSVGVPQVYEFRRQKDITACKDHLRGFHDALVDYSSQNGDRFPNVAQHPWPRNVAGMVVPLLHTASKETPNVICPANGTQAHPAQGWSLEKLRALDPHEFNQDIADQLLGSYAYSLGYRDAGGNCHSLRREGNGHLPIMADRPPPDAGAGNSLNHGGRGQNVLFINGSVQFLDTPTILDDHIYLNRNNKVAAGVDENDTVLGASKARPNPEVDEDDR